jgi:hypothetical protein
METIREFHIFPYGIGKAMEIFCISVPILRETAGKTGKTTTCALAADVSPI